MSAERWPVFAGPEAVPERLAAESAAAIAAWRKLSPADEAEFREGLELMPEKNFRQEEHLWREQERQLTALLRDARARLAVLEDVRPKREAWARSVGKPLDQAFPSFG